MADTAFSSRRSTRAVRRRSGRSLVVALTALILALAGSATPTAGPSRFGFSDRVERHLFPEVTTGPAEPAFSPDGQWIAFSMQHDIWKVNAAGGDAVGLTKGPWSYFEPAWSPDGQWIAVTIDTGGNLDIGRIPAAGGPVERLTEGREADIEPVWSHDGQDVFFASSRGRGFDIFKLHLADRTVTSVVADGGDQLQPAISPDGKTLSFVSPVTGKLGTGGIWTRSVHGGLETLYEDMGTPKLVHYEESEYRMRPVWTPDGKSFLFGSDEMGSNDIAIVPAAGGNPVVLTNDAMGEFSPAISPDGKRFAFISNRAGPMTLYTAPIGGGPLSSWEPVKIGRRVAAYPTGVLRLRVTDVAGEVLPARLTVKASDGRSYAPDDGFARVMAVTETHYFHASRPVAVTVPAGTVEVTAGHGPEFVRRVQNDVRMLANTPRELTLVLNRRFDAPARGWYSGDTHAHDLHQGRFGLMHQTLFEQSLAEDLHVTNVLIHMDGTRLMGRWADLTGGPIPASTKSHILQFAEEFRGSLGHIGMLGLKRYILPLTGGVNNTAYAQVASDVPYLDGARAQGGIAGFMHPYTRASQDPAAPNPAQWADSLIPVDVALGKGEFYDVASLYSDERGSAEMYYRLLNCGFRLAATGGTDNFPDVWRDPPPGTDRTYAKVEGPLTVQAWLAAIKAGRTFGTTGPLLFLTVNGQEPGSEIRLDGATTAVRVNVEVPNLMAIDRVEILVNGKVVSSEPGPRTDTMVTEVRTVPAGKLIEVPDGGWIAARVVGPSATSIGDSFAFAQTSPVYVVRNGTPFVSKSDAAFLALVVDAIGLRTMRGPWRSDAERDAFKREIDQARAVYQRLSGS